MQMGRVAKLWGKSPSEYADVEQGSLEAYLMDLGIAVRMNVEDAKATADRSGEQQFASQFPKLRTDFDS